MPIKTVYIQRQDDPEGRSVLNLARSSGYIDTKEVRIERAALIEGEVDPRDLYPIFANPLYEQIAEESFLDSSLGPIIEVAYQLAVTDPETPSVFDATNAMGITNLSWVRLARRYQFVGLTDEQARALAGEFLYNKVVQELVPPGKVWETLYPHGTPDPLRTISLAGLSDEKLVQLSIDMRWNAPLSQMKVIQAHEQQIGRPHTDAEIEMIVQTWCDHCYHTTWTSLGLLDILKDATARIANPDVVSAYTDNAGGFRFYDDWVIILKGETHNHPSAMATLGGILTKHGGVIRDILFFALGGYPIGGTTIMGIMDPRWPKEKIPAGALHPKRILLEAIAGTAGYLNPMGIPPLKVEYRIHPGYPKCFALGHSMGIIPEKFAQKGKPQKGDLVFLVGGRTGRDGIHGATGSSGELTVDVIERHAAEVQIGHPITERKMMTATPIIRDSRCARDDTDLGAGGISCAIDELAKGVGADIDIGKVHLKDNSLADWEICLSESQERGLYAVIPDKREEMEQILNLYEIEYAILGEFTGDNILTIRNGDRLVAQHDLGWLWSACPIDKQEVRKPVRHLEPITRKVPSTREEWREAAFNVVSHFHCADQSAAIFQYDQTVQGTTVVGPLGGKNGQMPNNFALKAPLRGKPYGAGLTNSFEPFYGEIDPAKMVELSHIEAVSYAAAAGARLQDMFASSNYYTPKIMDEIGPEVAWNLTEMVKAQAKANLAFGIPTGVGKDSSSGTFGKGKDRIDVPYTFDLAIAFKMPDVKRAITKPLRKAGNSIVWVGPCNPDALGGSVYLDCYGERGDTLPNTRAEEMKILYDSLYDVYKHCELGVIASSSAIGNGGLFQRLFEMAYGSDELGVYVNLSFLNPGRPDGILFGEQIGSIILEVSDVATFSQVSLEQGLLVRHIGVVTDRPTLEIESKREPILDLTVAELAAAWERTFKEVVG